MFRGVAQLGGSNSFFAHLPAREVGNFVPAVAGLAEESIRNFVFRGLVVRVGHRKLPAGDLRAHFGSFFDDKGVSADVVRFHCDRFFKRGLPVRQAFSGGSVDEVD